MMLWKLELLLPVVQFQTIAAATLDDPAEKKVDICSPWDPLKFMAPGEYVGADW